MNFTIANLQNWLTQKINSISYVWNNNHMSNELHKIILKTLWLIRRI